MLKATEYGKKLMRNKINKSRTNPRKITRDILREEAMQKYSDQNIQGNPDDYSAYIQDHIDEYFEARYKTVQRFVNGEPIRSTDIAISICNQLGLSLEEITNDIMQATEIHRIISDTQMTDEDIIHRIDSLINNNSSLINQLDDQCRTPLFIAIEREKVIVVDYLLKHSKIDPNLTNIRGFAPIHKAASLGNEPILDLLIKNPNVDIYLTTVKGGANAIYEAAFGGDNLNIVKMLMQAGVNINITSKDGFTALMVAIWRENYAVAHFLAERVNEENINARDEKGETALYKAICKGKFYITHMLLIKKADYTLIPNLDAQPIYQSTDLIHEIKNNNLNNIKNLIKKYEKEDTLKIIIDEPEKPYHRTPLSLAAEAGNLEIVKLLVEKGADLFITNNHGRTPKEMVLKQNYRLFRYLEEQESNRLNSLS